MSIPLNWSRIRQTKYKDINIREIQRWIYKNDYVPLTNMIQIINILSRNGPRLIFTSVKCCSVFTHQD